ncbi:hypothetical protein NSPZN2_30479 [Nitrospira defluvii]|uniref:Uncharacterized protein n=1 Tax=Nitrospira defluvii TaxID=330214 RepID=A0ABN7LPU7_9BACT|nr:hypothetical protein NSPZN2_30479 [Nitrospira defluvii]
MSRPSQSGTVALAQSPAGSRSASPPVEPGSVKQPPSHISDDGFYINTLQPRQAVNGEYGFLTGRRAAATVEASVVDTNQAPQPRWPNSAVTSPCSCCPQHSC